MLLLRAALLELLVCYHVVGGAVLGISLFLTWYSLGTVNNVHLNRVDSTAHDQ